MTLNSVVLPAPFGPMRPVTAPASARMVTSSSGDAAAEADGDGLDRQRRHDRSCRGTSARARARSRAAAVVGGHGPVEPEQLELVERVDDAFGRRLSVEEPRRQERQQEPGDAGDHPVRSVGPPGEGEPELGGDDAGEDDGGAEQRPGPRREVADDAVGVAARA